MRAEIVICGAGIAGVSAAYHLAVRQGVRDIVLVDERSPLSLTSDKSAECYRNWWPHPAMVGLMNHSTDLLWEIERNSGYTFQVNQRGYLFVSGRTKSKLEFELVGRKISALGAGPLRVHRNQLDDPDYPPSPKNGFDERLTGADLFLDSSQIQSVFPFLTPEAEAALYIRRAGWFSAQQYGMYLLEQARHHGVRRLRARVANVRVENGRLQSIRLLGENAPEEIVCKTFIIAAGPFLKSVGAMLGVDLPVYCELHAKLAVNDVLGVLPREAPLVIWADPQKLTWTDEEQALLIEEGASHLLGKLPSGAHTRPEGGAESQMILMLWGYHLPPVEPEFPIAFDPLLPDVVLRGLRRMIPGTKTYLQRLPKPRIDGGYYTRTQENMPLIGPLPVKGAYVIGALSGFGMMASSAAGELLAAHITGSPLPDYAPAFLLERYQDAAYLQEIEQLAQDGQI